MNIKKNDTVKIIAGKDKGKTGKIIQIFADTNRASVDGLNLLVKHLRPRRAGEKGQRVEFPAPLNISNLMVVCPKCGQPTRVGHRFLETAEGKRGAKVRFCKKCQTTLD